MAELESYECIVIGGGPAGATCATLLADQGHSVLLLERESAPKRRIGESLMPHTYWTFKRLGLLDALKASDFPRKESVQFVSAEGKDSLPYYFTDRDPSEWSTTWQVPRDRFDQMMLDNAARHGVDVHQGASVTQVRLEGPRAVGVTAVIDNMTVNLPCKVVIDASGQSSLIARQLGISSFDHDLRSGAIYSYYRGAYRDEGRNSGATIIINTPDRTGWFWYIPLPDDVTSVGIVAPPAYLFTNRGADPLVTLENEIEKCAGVRKRLQNATRIEEARVTRDFSYRASRIAGDGWVLIGDAFGFLDPIYSSGVMLALQSGERAADTIHEALEADDLTGERLGAFGPKLVAGMELLRRLVHAFYDRNFSFAKFTQAHPEYKDHLVRLLIGDVFNDEVGEVFDVLGDWVDLPAPIQLQGSSIAS